MTDFVASHDQREVGSGLAARRLVGIWPYLFSVASDVGTLMICHGRPTARRTRQVLTVLRWAVHT